MRSLRSRLFVVWALSLVASVAVGGLMLGLYSRTSAVQFARADNAVSDACDNVRDTWGYYGADWSGPAPPLDDRRFRADLGSVLVAALAPRDGIGGGSIGGGIWSASAGSLAVTPDGVAAAAAEAAEQPAREALAQDRDVLERRTVPAGYTFIVAACPLRGAVEGLAAWTAEPVPNAAGLFQLRAGLAALLVLVVVISAWLTWLVASWTRHVRSIETALATHAAGGVLPTLAPPLAPTGERELDRIVAALNTASARLAAAQAQAAEMSARVAQSERLAALGRVAAGVAHEIRNPIAAMRLRAENALAGPETRRAQALEAMLGQIARLDRLLASLLAMTQATPPQPQPVDLAAFLAECMGDHADAAAARGVHIAASAPEVRLRFDPDIVRRALANLVQNAVRETRAGGSVRVEGALDGGRLRITVADDGPGVAASVREKLFEPFVTGRADGTGLGLSIARELIVAHGGTLTLAPSDAGAVFVVELPVGAPCPSS